MSHKIDEEQVAKDTAIVNEISRIEKALRRIKKWMKTSETNTTLPKKETNPQVTEILRVFAEKYDQAKELPYSINWSKDGTLAKNLLVTYSFEGLQNLVEHYLHMNDSFFADHGFSFPIFASQINKIAYSYDQQHGGQDGTTKTHYR